VTTLAISGEDFLIDGAPANAGRALDGIPLDGLLLNSRMINGIFDDLNPDTRRQWAYPDTGRWDPDRNTDEFIAAMPQWRADGLDAFTLGVQCGSPQGYSKRQPWDSGGYEPDGALRPAHFGRLRRILGEADRLGFAVILSLFYQGQEMRLADADAVRRAVRDTARFVLDAGWQNVALEIANECNIPHDYTHSRLMRGENVHELIELAQSVRGDGRRLLASASFVDVSYFRDTVPDAVFVTTDDHFDFGRDYNHMKSALRAHVSWGYFDPGSVTTWPDPAPTLGDYRNGFQAVPVNWGPSSALKRAFFDTLRRAT